MKIMIVALFNLMVAGLPVSGGLESNDPPAGDLVVLIRNLKNTKGQIGILVFDQKEGFPAESAKAVRDVLVPVTGPAMTYTFTGLPYGEYAVSVMHDENNNRELDTNLFGIPKEGNGVSNDAVGKFGPPRFEEAAFNFQKNNQSVQINIRY